MSTSTRNALFVALAIVILLLLLFGGGALSGTMMSGGMMGNGSAGMMGGLSWMWLPTILILGLGVLLGWVIFGRKPE